ncbi:hypothetical protein MKX03_009894 [Papaver bracteatum]|nr:hypothetical protein MKX03_009894 [Papaver bracteatum]
MASFSALKIGSFLPCFVGLVLAYHVVILVEGGRDFASRLSEEEDLELERKLKTLNKPPIKTMDTRWGDIYDCIEFHKQPAFDHPLLKNHAIPKKVETTSARPHKTLTGEIEECPKGTVPIRRTTKEDLIRAKHFSSSSNALRDFFKAGINVRKPAIEVQKEDQFYGASGTANIWSPKVNRDQSSGGEMALLAGSKSSVGEMNEIRFGWTVSPELYGDTVTRTYIYWAGVAPEGYETDCYNTLCPGYVQVHSIHTPIIYFNNTSFVGGRQTEITARILREPENGEWWLTIKVDESDIQIGYWPKELFPLFKPGAEYVYWGGSVRSDYDGITPDMASGLEPDDDLNRTGYYSSVGYTDMDDIVRTPSDNEGEVESMIDCKGHYDTGSYNAIWDDSDAVLRFGGPSGHCM